MRAWLAEHGGDLSPDKHAAVTGLATSDAAVAVLIGPAGTGKSTAVGAFADAWSDLTGGRVIGLATSQVATQVLTDDGLTHTRNIARWLAIQERLDRHAERAGRSSHPGKPYAEAGWRLRPTDVVVVDEASMVATADVHEIRTRVDAAGARLMLVGDPRQLGAVEAGGVLDLLDGHAETYTLSTVHRFANAWERDASLALRDPARAGEALTEYDRHGRLVAHDSTEDALAAAATAAVADRVDGHSTLIVTDTNKVAAAASAHVRDQLLALGLVERPETGGSVVLGRDSNTASIGDHVMTRHNDHRLGVTNRARYVLTAIHPDGSLALQPITSDTPATGHQQAGGPGTGAAGGPGKPAGSVTVPADYVAEHVQLAYAATVHAAEGLTLTTGTYLTDGRTDPASVLVALTRGRLRNTAHVITTPTPDPTGLPEKFSVNTERPSALAVLDGVMDRPADPSAGGTAAATVVAETDAAQAINAATLLGQIEAVTRHATRTRLETHLDELTADGVISEHTRARLCVDQGIEHLSRLLRAAEQAGHDPRQVLHAAADARSLETAKSTAQVLSHRITRNLTGVDDTLPMPNPDTASTPPADVDIANTTALADLHTQLRARHHALGVDLVDQPPAWLTMSLGSAPDKTVADIKDQDAAELANTALVNDDRRQDWTDRAGAVAAYREATGWDHPTRALGPMPGLAATERRAAYATAWTALGRPTPELSEAAMSDGQLRARYRAWQAELEWAPPHADDALRAAETDVETHRQAAAIARAQAEHAATSGDRDAAAQLRAQVARHQATQAARRVDADGVATVVDARAQWVALTAVTREHGERALAELRDRDLDPGTEPDRVTTTQWMADHQRAQAEDETHREITPADVHDDATTDHNTPSHLDDLPEGAAPMPISDADLQTNQSAGETTNQSCAHRLVPRQPTGAELDSLVAAAQIANAQAADRVSAHASEPPPAQADRDARHRREALDEVSQASDRTSRAEAVHQSQ